jgi:hypothetical protein
MPSSTASRSPLIVLKRGVEGTREVINSVNPLVRSRHKFSLPEGEGCILDGPRGPGRTNREPQVQPADKCRAMKTNRPQPSPPFGGEGAESVRPSAANGPERSEGAQAELREPGDGVQPAIFRSTGEGARGRGAKSQ